MDCGWWPWVHLCLLDWCSSQPVSTQSGQKFCAEVSDLCCLEVRACRLRLPSRFYPRSSISAADWPPEPVRLVGAPEGSPSKVGRCTREPCCSRCPPCPCWREVHTSSCHHQTMTSVSVGYSHALPAHGPRLPQAPELDQCWRGLERFI